jgi:uncharacterized protein (DUF1330 family)
VDEEVGRLRLILPPPPPIGQAMPAYMIVTARISDPQAFRAYAERARRAWWRSSVAATSCWAQPQALEGASADAGAKWVILEWPDVASARRFWDSAEYAEVKRLRDGTGQFEVRLLEGPAPAALSTDRST